MPLPKMSHPTRKITVPSTGKKIAIRPFTVKEEKILLSVAKDSVEFGDVISQILNNCIIGDFDVDTAPMFDMEYIYLKLYAFSVNNILEFQRIEEDGSKSDLELNLNDVEIKKNPEHTNKIELSGDVGVIMRYPNLNTMIELRKKIKAVGDDNPVEILFSIFAQCIEKVWEGDKVYVVGSDFTMAEAEDFIENLSSDNFVKMTDFFNTIPILSHEVEYMTPKGEKKTVVLEGLDEFFP